MFSSFFSSYAALHSFWHNQPTWFEPQRQETYLLTLRPTKTQIRLRIRAVWSESSLAAWRNFVMLAVQNWPSGNFDQTTRMRRLIWILDGRTCAKVRFLTLRLICAGKHHKVTWDTSATRIQTSLYIRAVWSGPVFFLLLRKVGRSENGRPWAD